MASSPRECLWMDFKPYFEEVEMAIDNWDAYKSEQPGEQFQDSNKVTGFESVKNFIAEQLHSAAEGLGDKGAEQSAESEIDKYRKQASEWLNQSAEYVRTFDPKQADASIREYVKESPDRKSVV